MDIGIVGIQQIKVPVSDLQRSVAWYRSLLDLELVREFVEQGELRGATLADRQIGIFIGLRHREVVPGRPTFAGFDLFSIGVSSLAALHNVAARCDRLNIAHGDLIDRGSDGTHLDVPDPDGTVVRFLSPFSSDGPDFVGVEFHDDEGTMSFYDAPRLMPLDG